MGANGNIVILTPEGLQRADVQTYNNNWGINQEKEQEVLIENFLNGIKKELVAIINSQKKLYSTLTPDGFRNICNQLSFGKDVVTLEDIFSEVTKLEDYQKKQKKNKDIKLNTKKFSESLEKARKQELAAQKGIASLLAKGTITKEELPKIIIKLRELSKKKELTENNINQIINKEIINYLDQEDEIVQVQYDKLFQLVDQYRKAPGFQIENGKIKMNNIEDVNQQESLAKRLESLVKKIKKQEGITQSSSEKKKKEVAQKIRRSYIRRGKEMETGIVSSNTANYELQKLIDELTVIAKEANSSKSEEKVRQIVRTNVINFIDDYISASSISSLDGLYSFKTNDNLGIYGLVSEELQATTKLKIKGIKDEVIEISSQVLGSRQSRTIKKVVGQAVATYSNEIYLPNLDMYESNANQFTYNKIAEVPESDKGDVVYQLKNILKDSTSKTNNMYIAFSDKFRNFGALMDQAIIGDDEETSTLLNSKDLFANTTNAHSIIFALLNWHSVSYLSGAYQGIEQQIKQAINTQILDFALNRKNLLSNIEASFMEQAQSINDNNTLYAFRLGANTFIPTYQILESILVQMNNVGTIEEIVSTTISQSSIGTSAQLFNQALSLHPPKDGLTNSQARWNYVAEQTAAAIQIRTAIHFNQLMQLFTPKI